MNTDERMTARFPRMPVTPTGQQGQHGCHDEPLGLDSEARLIRRRGGQYRRRSREPGQNEGGMQRPKIEAVEPGNKLEFIVHLKEETERNEEEVVRTTYRPKDISTWLILDTNATAEARTHNKKAWRPHPRVGLWRSFFFWPFLPFCPRGWERKPLYPCYVRFLGSLGLIPRPQNCLKAP